MDRSSGLRKELARALLPGGPGLKSETWATHSCIYEEKFDFLSEWTFGLKAPSSARGCN